MTTRVRVVDADAHVYYPPLGLETASRCFLLSKSEPGLLSRDAYTTALLLHLLPALVHDRPEVSDGWLANTRDICATFLLGT